MQAHKLPTRFYIANHDKILRKRFKGSKGIWKHHYIAHASEDYINAIIIDVDSDVKVDAILSVLPTNLLPTSITGIFKKKNYEKSFVRPHIRFNLSTPIKKSSIKHISWFNSVVEELQRLISQVATVDKNTPAYVTKNPLSGKWDYQTFGDFAFKEYDLKELSNLLNLKRKPTENKYSYKNENVIDLKTRKVFNNDVEVGYRNDDLFNSVRYQVYPLKAKVQSHEELYQLTYRLCASHNSTYKMPLKDCDVKATAKSIASWTWKNFSGNHQDTKNRGAASKYIDDEYDIRKRQQVGALYSNEERSKKALKTLSEAIDKARTEGSVVTKKGLAKVTGLSLSTVKKYWEQAQHQNVISITETKRKLLSLRGGVTVSSEKVYLNNTEQNQHEVSLEDEHDIQKSDNIPEKTMKICELEQMTYALKEREEGNQAVYSYQSYATSLVRPTKSNEDGDDGCPF